MSINSSVALLCMLAPIWKHSRMVVVKQLKIYKNETLSCYKEILTITHKLLNEPFSSSSSSFMCWTSSISFSFLQENTWKIIFIAKLFFYLYNVNHDYIHLKDAFIDMAPRVMQFCQFFWPSPYTRLWTFLLACFAYQHIDHLGFS